MLKKKKTWVLKDIVFTVGFQENNEVMSSKYEKPCQKEAMTSKYKCLLMKVGQSVSEGRQ